MKHQVVEHVGGGKGASQFWAVKAALRPKPWTNALVENVVQNVVQKPWTNAVAQIVGETDQSMTN